jgi:ketosteroid isomerase-like protein
VVLKLQLSAGILRGVSSENEQVVRRLLLAYAGADFPAALSILDPRVRVYPRPEEPGADEFYTGPDGLFEYLGNWLGQWDHYETEPLSFREAPGDRVMVVMAERGHLKRSGITLDQEYTHSFTVGRGKVTEWRMYDSHAHALQELGLEG